MTGKRSNPPGRGFPGVRREGAPPEKRREIGGGEKGTAGPSEHALGVWFLRAIHGWTQQELARASGVHQSRISLYEAGRRTPSRATLARLADGARFPLYLLDRLVAVFRSSLAAAGLALPAPAAEDEGGVAQAVARAVSGAVLVAEGELAAAGAGARSPREQAAAERAAAPGRWAMLAPLDPEDQRFLVENAREHRSFALCELICEASAEAAPREPARALALADLALFVAARAEGDEPWRMRLEGYAWAFAGNARRAAADLAGAREAFARSRALWEAGAAADPGILDAARRRDLEAPPLPDPRRLGSDLR